MVRISTTAGLEQTAPGRSTPSIHQRIIGGRPYTPPTFSPSCVMRYSSPLATHHPTTSAVRSFSPAGQPTSGKRIARILGVLCVRSTERSECYRKSGRDVRSPGRQDATGYSPSSQDATRAQATLHQILRASPDAAPTPEGATRRSTDV